VHSDGVHQREPGAPDVGCVHGDAVLHQSVGIQVLCAVAPDEVLQAILAVHPAKPGVRARASMSSREHEVVRCCCACLHATTNQARALMSQGQTLQDQNNPQLASQRMQLSLSHMPASHMASHITVYSPGVESVCQRSH